MSLRRPPPEAWLFALAFGTFAFFYQAGGWNSNVRFDLVRAIVEHRTLAIDAYQKNTGDKAQRGEHYYSDKAPGISLLSVPAYAAAFALRPDLTETDVFQGWASYACVLLSVALPSALATAVLFRICVLLSLSPAARSLVPLAYAFGTLALPYSTLYYGHQTAAAFVVIAWWLVLRDPRSCVTAGMFLGLAVLVEYPAAIAALCLAGYTFARARSPRVLLRLAAGMALPLLVLAWYHTAAFGSPLALPYDFSTQAPRHVGFMGVGVPEPRVLYHLLIGEYRGLFFSAPWLLLALPGIILWLREPTRRADGILCAAVFLSYLWLAAGLADWHGGWGTGPRHLIVTLPLLAVAAGRALPARAPVWLAAAALACVVYSASLMFAATAVKPEVPRAIERPFGEFVLPAFRAGNLSINTQSVDMVTGRDRTVRQAWTLGEKLGFGGWLRLLPLLIYVLGTACGFFSSVRSLVHHRDRA